MRRHSISSPEKNIRNNEFAELNVIVIMTSSVSVGIDLVLYEFNFSFSYDSIRELHGISYFKNQLLNLLKEEETFTFCRFL